MSLNIRCDEGVMSLAIYNETLNNKLVEVANKTGANVKSVEWIIYEAEKKVDLFNCSTPIRVTRYGEEYGFMPLGTQQAWISTRAIREATLVSGHFSNLSCFKEKSDILADIIIDELVHVETQKDHGTKEYDELHDSYCRKFYGSVQTVQEAKT